MRERGADRARSFLIFAENGTNVTYRMLFAPMPARIDNTVSGNFTNGIAASFISAPFVPSFRSPFPSAVTSLPGNIVRAAMIGFLPHLAPIREYP